MIIPLVYLGILIATFVVVYTHQMRIEVRRGKTAKDADRLDSFTIALGAASLWPLSLLFVVLYVTYRELDKVFLKLAQGLEKK